MGAENWEQANRTRLDKALTDFLRKRISADEYEYIRSLTYQEYMNEQRNADRQAEFVN